ncbi:hypothetical protein [Herbiconiux daphne]|uniref:Alkaline shock response membrane anchor protein AmaP n=1 Tax=Herbiconiux daphne TaxID=2970914 RepID=A0ABT2H3W0_9MICO|nr:hypothetical protein [Herbiconiux daphne]MCS5734592.1 hypothetical protein [Herbiconiux daphne]
MNSTNRGANRLVILLFGLLALALGAGAIALGLVAGARDAFDTGASSAIGTLGSFSAETGVAATSLSVLWIVALAALAVVVVLLVVFIQRQGRGHHGRVLESEPDADGRTLIDSGFAESALSEALADSPEIVSSHVSTYRVKKTPVLKISATARRGVSPAVVVEVVERAVRALDELLGIRVPVLIQISGGLSTRVAKASRLQ